VACSRLYDFARKPGALKVVEAFLKQYGYDP
jgi:hypothetical protein